MSRNNHHTDRTPRVRYKEATFVRLLPEEKRQLRELADRNTRSLSAQIRAYVRQGLAQESDS